MSIIPINEHSDIVVFGPSGICCNSFEEILAINIHCTFIFLSASEKIKILNNNFRLISTFFMFRSFKQIFSPIQFFL